MHDVGGPPAERVSELEHRRNGAKRANAVRNDKEANAITSCGGQQLISLASMSPELECVGTAENGDVVIHPRERARLLRSVLQEEVTDDQDAHHASIRRRPSERPLCAGAAVSSTRAAAPRASPYVSSVGSAVANRFL